MPLEQLCLRLHGGLVESLLFRAAVQELLLERLDGLGYFGLQHRNVEFVLIVMNAFLVARVSMVQPHALLSKATTILLSSIYS